MKRAGWFVAAGALWGIVLTAGMSRADVLNLTPTQAVALPDDGSGMSAVAFAFDFSGMRQGSWRRIESALLEWPLEGMPSNRGTEYFAYPVTTPWTVESVGLASVTIGISAEPASNWNYGPTDHLRNQGGMVRLDLTSLVTEWLTGTSANNGIVVKTRDVSRQTLASQLAGARLILRYGFLRWTD